MADVYFVLLYSYKLTDIEGQCNNNLLLEQGIAVYPQNHVDV